MTNTATDRGGEHAPVSYLNRTDSGVRSFVGCACGVMPKKMPQTMSGMDASYFAHIRKLGLARPRNIAHVVFGEGPAEGMTWDEWRASSPNGDPFGVRNG